MKWGPDGDAMEEALQKHLVGQVGRLFGPVYKGGASVGRLPGNMTIQQAQLEKEGTWEAAKGFYRRSQFRKGARVMLTFGPKGSGSKGE